MKARGGFIDDEALVVAEEPAPTLSAELAGTGGPGIRWVMPIRLDRHRASSFARVRRKSAATNTRNPTAQNPPKL